METRVKISVSEVQIRISLTRFVFSFLKGHFKICSAYICIRHTAFVTNNAFAEILPTAFPFSGFWNFWISITFIVGWSAMRCRMIYIIRVIGFVELNTCCSRTCCRCGWSFDHVFLPNFVQVSLGLFGDFLRTFCIFCCGS